MESWTFLAFAIASAITLGLAVAALLLERRS
jgi:hypothetical protein